MSYEKTKGNNRNRLCFCGRLGKKIKSCYGLDRGQNTCPIFLQEHEAENKKIIEENIDGICSEVMSSVSLLNKNIELNKSTNIEKNNIRSQFILIFSLASAFTKIWIDFFNITDLKNKDREAFTQRCDVFCKKNENPYLKNFQYLKNIDYNRLYKLRSSLMHKFSIIDIEFVLINGPMDTRVSNIMDQYKKELGESLFPIYAIDLCSLFIGGGSVMIDLMNKKGQENKYEYLLALQRLSNSFSK